jgi:hypothetical protein
MENRSARSSCISNSDKDEEEKNFQMEVPSFPRRFST